jgi:hypothetical protein
MPTLADFAAHAGAVIRLWPKLDLQQGRRVGDQRCAMLVVSCLELGVEEADMQLLIQSAQALTLTQVKSDMCVTSLSRAPNCVPGKCPDPHIHTASGQGPR